MLDGTHRACMASRVGYEGGAALARRNRESIEAIASECDAVRSMICLPGKHETNQAPVTGRSEVEAWSMV
jgi:hypothetical protein